LLSQLCSTKKTKKLADKTIKCCEDIKQECENKCERKNGLFQALEKQKARHIAEL